MEDERRPASEKECLKVFSKAQKEGKIPFDEMKDMIRMLGFSPINEEFEDVRAKLDPNGDGQVSEEEFLAFIRSQPQDQEGALKEAFQCYTKDETQSIDRNEIRAVLLRDSSIDEKDVDELLDLADTNKDGRLDAEEMAKLMTKRHKQDSSDSDSSDD